eukprot:m.324090 g.324090  ORF g.324090 m.324090 type:complete len:266 (-) comp16540_c10_seq5:199-996(-)
MAEKTRRIGVVGYGKLGQFLVKKILESKDLGLSLAFVWNRDSTKLKGLEDHILLKLEDVKSRSPDLIIEVAHPDVTVKYGELFLKTCDFMVGSPTVFADEKIEKSLASIAAAGPHGMYIPSGALWGAVDIQKMDALGTIKSLKITMRKHPDCFRLFGDLKDKNEAAKAEGAKPTTLYEGPVRQLCPLAPNNVNTMAAACLAAPSLGFDKVIGCVEADRSLQAHIVEVEVIGPGDPPFRIHTVRTNPNQLYCSQEQSLAMRRITLF